jgi:hypothetical protein
MMDIASGLMTGENIACASCEGANWSGGMCGGFESQKAYRRNGSLMIRVLTAPIWAEWNGAKKTRLWT